MEESFYFVEQNGGRGMTGTYEHSIDNAGRLIVPSKLRDKLGSAFYLAVGVKENLTLYPMETWDKLRQRVSELSTTDAAAMDLFFASAQLCEADKQWRIWSADNWKAKTRQQLNPETIANLMKNLGI